MASMCWRLTRLARVTGVQTSGFGQLELISTGPTSDIEWTTGVRATTQSPPNPAIVKSSPKVDNIVTYLALKLTHPSLPPDHCIDRISKLTASASASVLLLRCLKLISAFCALPAQISTPPLKSKEDCASSRSDPANPADRANDTTSASVTSLTSIQQATNQFSQQRLPVFETTPGHPHCLRAPLSPWPRVAVLTQVRLLACV